MVKHILKIREVDQKVFVAIKNGEKTIETRATTPKYGDIKSGDILVFTCHKKRLEKMVEKVKFYKTIDDMVKEIDFRQIMPFADSVEEMKKVYYSFPNYQEKIRDFGLVAFWLR